MPDAASEIESPSPQKKTEKVENPVEGREAVQVEEYAIPGVWLMLFDVAFLHSCVHDMSGQRATCRVLSERAECVTAWFPGHRPSTFVQLSTLSVGFASSMLRKTPVGVLPFVKSAS